MYKKRLIEILILIIAAIIIILFADHSKPKIKKTYKEAELVPVNEHKIEYGIIVDSLIIYKNKVKRNQFLSEILLKYKVDYPTIDLLAKMSKPVFDVRRIRTGNNYTVLYSNDSLQKVQYFIYERSPTSYIVYDLRDTLQIFSGEKEIDIKIKTTSGIINSSLWNAIKNNKTDPNLANELSEIYAWTIDFFGIQKGDKYKIIYEELFVDERSIGIGKVLASRFYHAGNGFYAFYFVQDSIGDYFDDEANSMRRTFLKAPLRFKRISSRFSNSRLHPILKIRRPHHGVDYAAAYGTPVHSVGDGMVIYAKHKGGNGNLIKIKHNGTYTTAYLHLSRYAKGIKPGVYVKQGDIIGYVGSTGLSTGPHLDFRFYRNGKAIDPLKVKSPPAKPVDSTYIKEYNLLKDGMMKELELI